MDLNRLHFVISKLFLKHGSDKIEQNFSDKIKINKHLACLTNVKDEEFIYMS